MLLIIIGEGMNVHYRYPMHCYFHTPNHTHIPKKKKNPKYLPFFHPIVIPHDIKKFGGAHTHQILKKKKSKATISSTRVWFVRYCGGD